jgi:hypothetical protein
MLVSNVSGNVKPTLSNFIYEIFIFFFPVNSGLFNGLIISFNHIKTRFGIEEHTCHTLLFALTRLLRFL